VTAFRRPSAALAGATALLALAACSSSSPKAASSTTSTTSAATSVSTSTTTAVATRCVLGHGFAPGTAVHQMTVDGEARELMVHIPPDPAPSMRLVVDFHGATSNMQQQDFYSDFDALADKQGFVVATPNGIDGAIRQWRFLNPKDIDFAKAIVANLARNACVDRAHAYATGISSGGAMTTSLACRASDVFAGFAPVAAEFYYAGYCGAAKPRPMIIFHGTADPVVPYAGGKVGTNSGLSVRNTEATAAQWAQHNRCTSGPVTTHLGSEVTRLSWNGCKAPVVLYRIDGGGHTWPGAIVDIPRLGLTTHQIKATDTMWKLFTQYG
jgi:polyhydroxybutyrate depolymerase